MSGTKLLQGKVAVVTGANRGIGKAILEVFASNGADVFACARSESEIFLKTIEKLENDNKVIIKPVYFDLQDEEQVKNAARFIIGEKRPIDILVNNAGVASGSFFQMTKMQDASEVMKINFFSQILFSQNISRYMAKRKSGSIINVGSTAGLIGDIGTISYGASKAALMYATKTMAAELGRQNIRVNAIAPNITKTDMFDQMDEKARAKAIESTALGRAAEVNEIANVVLFLASDLASYVTAQVIRVDGGLTT